MKVTVEGTAEELLDLVELLALGKGCRSSKNTNTARRDVRDLQARDDVPNRFREEGV